MMCNVYFYLSNVLSQKKIIKRLYNLAQCFLLMWFHCFCFFFFCYLHFIVGFSKIISKILRYHAIYNYIICIKKNNGNFSTWIYIDKTTVIHYYRFCFCRTFSFIQLQPIYIANKQCTTKLSKRLLESLPIHVFLWTIAIGWMYLLLTQLFRWSF